MLLLTKLRAAKIGTDADAAREAFLLTAFLADALKGT
jgi:hypothetical protein